ncbi:hypothetical protein WME89_33420 [Sorangium sp. So ce321]|uniref:hypothetical protein n=1 Tax=Sorangium sp. So ce321 TaxID=3133300 RepID=UPI003F61BC8E
MKWIKKVDHITYAVAKGMMNKWAWYHIEIEGGTLVNRIDDVNPNDPSSSMKLWCIDFETFGIALVEGIDRAERSQVSVFVEKHGDHSVQHVAYDTVHLGAFLERARKHGVRLRGETLLRNDGFGMVKQVFSKGYDGEDPADMQFAEYVERQGAHGEAEPAITFSSRVGKGFYYQIEQAREQKDRETFIDFGRMPQGWRPPAPVDLDAELPRALDR